MDLKKIEIKSTRSVLGLSLPIRSTPRTAAPAEQGQSQHPKFQTPILGSTVAAQGLAQLEPSSCSRHFHGML